MNCPRVNRFFLLRSLASGYTIFSMGRNDSEKEATKKKFLKRDLLSMIADLEKVSYIDIYQTLSAR